ncbi:MAG: hypothetical protein ACRDHH_05725 [Actinomycetota bacterium]
MRFVCGYRRYTITFKTGYQANETRDNVKVEAIRIEFRSNVPGGMGEFDSEAAQRRYRWSDEVRQQVERTLMSHRRFGGSFSGARGRGIYLVEGQEVPEYLADLITAPEGETPQVVMAENVLRCVAIEGLTQCERDAVPGSDLCARHGGVPVQDKGPTAPEALADEDAIFCAATVGEGEDERACRNKAKSGEAFCAIHLRARMKAEAVS